MKRLVIFISLVVAMAFSASAQETVPAGETFLEPLQKRDSVLIADQFRYGVIIDGLVDGDAISLPEIEKVFNDTLVLVHGWQLDTLGRRGLFGRKNKGGSPLSVRAAMLLAPFEAGEYHLPDIPVLRRRGDVDDTLLFSGQTIDVVAVQVDTASFVPHDIKGLMRYPLTMQEVLPYILGFQLVATIVILIVCIVMSRRRRDKAEVLHEPPYITALKSLDRFRGDKYWAPEKQKAMYSGITDALRTYIESRFGINAEEMTTAEIFDALKGDRDIPEELMAEVRHLFELADFVKFAKHTATEEDNAAAVPVAVRFVTSAYQSQLDKEAAGEGEGK